MDEDLTLPVSYKGGELSFLVKIIASGFGYRFAVLIDGREVIFEKDDGGEYRAVMYNAEQCDEAQPDLALLAAIAAVIASIGV